MLSILPVALSALTFASTSNAQLANTFKVVGNTGVSAQQMFLGTKQKVYIVDKTENNIAQVDGHPAWATEYDLSNNTYRAQAVVTNTFCAGGAALGNGSWINVGGNQAVTTGGVADNTAHVTEGGGPYFDKSGGRAVRVLTPCDDETCEWSEVEYGMPLNRWYPYVEVVETGEALIIGGELYGGYVNNPSANQSVPTYEFWPTRGAPVTSQFLLDTQPANLYPLTWLLSNGLIFMQATWSTTLLNYTTNQETRLPNITHAQKTYPSSGGTAMLPMTIANNYSQILLFCGGMDPERDDWNPDLWAVVNTNTSSSCVSIDPHASSPTWKDDDDLPENRGMGNLIQLPDQRLLLVNGVGKGSAGYGWQSWVVGQSYAQDPVLRPAYYDPRASAGKRWSYKNLPSSTIGRLYHSSATLLPDGSVFIAGSNPNADVITEANNASYPYKTEYRSEIFYPDYYDAGRPVPSGIPSNLTYGGAYFNLSMPASSLNGTDLSAVEVSVLRTGFSTHTMNMGMKYLQLNHTFTGNKADGSAVLHVAQLPPNPALFVPGPALLFVTVNGIPSIGEMVMVGNGVLGQQPTAEVTELPPSSNNLGTTSAAPPSASASGSSGSSSGSSGSTSGASSQVTSFTTIWLALCLVALAIRY